MVKILRVGDPHVTIRNLSESKKIMDFVLEKAEEYSVDRVEFMGDLFHTHAVKRLEVENFWIEVFGKITKKFKVLSLVGNHDMVGSRESAHINALSVFKIMKNVTIVDKPTILDSIAYIPYTHDNDYFVGAAKMLYDEGAHKMLVAHQTFQGAYYENGFYAKDGIDLSLVPQEYIISGHIHSQQQTGKCKFIGTPKWDTISDANQEKGIWIYEHNDDGSISSQDFISTANVATPIKKITIKEEDSDNEYPELNARDRNYLELIGKSSWIAKMKKKYKSMAQIKGIPTDKKMDRIDKDLILSIDSYLDDFFNPISGVKKEDIKNYLRAIR